VTHQISIRSGDKGSCIMVSHITTGDTLDYLESNSRYNYNASLAAKKMKAL